VSLTLPRAGPRRRRGLGVRRRGAPAAALVAALALAACGGDAGTETAAPPEPAEEASAPREQGAEDAADGGADGEADLPAEDRPAPSGSSGSAAGAGCAFTAPPGRLARDEVAIELDDVACEDAVPLARAAALGQPAGANLAIERRGFTCEPSTKAKGENVTYTCTGPAGSATFEVAWTEATG
jgi:hypothetical protein